MKPSEQALLTSAIATAVLVGIAYATGIGQWFGAGWMVGIALVVFGGLYQQLIETAAHEAQADAAHQAKQQQVGGVDVPKFKLGDEDI